MTPDRDELVRMLEKATVRIGILVDRMRGCVEHEVNDSHTLSIDEGEAWQAEQNAVIDRLIHPAGGREPGGGGGGGT